MMMITMLTFNENPVILESPSRFLPYKVILHTRNFGKKEWEQASLVPGDLQAPQKLRKEYLSDQNSVLTSSIINFMMPRCLWTDEENEQNQPVNEAKLRTLEEWLLASPSLNKNSSSGGEHYVFKNFSPKVHFRRSLYVDKADYTSNSLEGLLKLDEVEKEELRASSQSGKTKKRVRFKLPEEADIFIFYSPAEDEF